MSVHACPAPPVPSAREAVLWRGLPDTEIQPGISFLWEQATGGHAHHGDVWPVCCMACGWRRAGTVGIASAGPSPDQRVGAAGASWAGGAGPWPSQGSASQCGGSHRTTTAALWELPGGSPSPKPDLHQTISFSGCALVEEGSDGHRVSRTLCLLSPLG